MKIKKLYTVVEIMCEHSLLNTYDDGEFVFTAKFENAQANFKVITGSVEWMEDGFVFNAKDFK
jgi:hypothetical protein